MRILAPVLIASVLVVCAAAAAPAPTKEVIAGAAARAQELLNSGQAEEARALLEPLIKGPSPDAQLVLLHSSALFLSGDNNAGRKELDRALQLDPTLRQAWLNRGALGLVEKHYDAAYSDLLAAEKLDPAASDNSLNLGAVLLLQGKLQAANERFQRYLQANPNSADALYLVATNYAMAGYNALATQNLSSAIALDERSRPRARADANFSDLAKTPTFQQLLMTDSYVLPAGGYHASETYRIQYETTKNRLLNAVLDAMRTARMPFDPNVEVTSDWALLFGELRIKVRRSSESDGGGVVEVSAPADRMTPQQWQERTQTLFREILIHLTK